MQATLKIGVKRLPSLMISKKTHFLPTLWDDFGEIEGTELQAKVKKDEYPVNLGRNIGISPYKGPNQIKASFNVVRSAASQGHPPLSCSPTICPRRNDITNFCVLFKLILLMARQQHSYLVNLLKTCSP